MSRENVWWQIEDIYGKGDEDIRLLIDSIALFCNLDMGMSSQLSQLTLNQAQTLWRRVSTVSRPGLTLNVDLGPFNSLMSTRSNVVSMSLALPSALPRKSSEIRMLCE